MKKSTIWILTIVMALTFGILMYFQITYLERMVTMRHAQFSENVQRSLQATADYLEKKETLYFLEKDAEGLSLTFYSDVGEDAPVSENSVSGGELKASDFDPSQDLAARYQKLQDDLRTKYQYQQGLLYEIILEIMQTSGMRPIEQRADSLMIRAFLTKELKSVGVNIPFEFAVETPGGKRIYASGGFEGKDEGANTYSIPLFPNSTAVYQLEVMFPGEGKYLFRSVRFIVPTLAFTLILLVVFIYTIATAFRQKKLSEMKNDFINNMTHEFKTPISTISLASQMMADPSVAKAPSMLANISKIIADETKRLRILVEQVLVFSMFDSARLQLNMVEVDVNTTVESVANTFKIKAEKYGGNITVDTEAEKSTVLVDAVHFTNVLFTILDNAVKYRRDDVPPELHIVTRNIEGHHTGSGKKDELEIRLSDNGIGIRREDIKRIFERFYRVGTGNRHDVKGFGIGLAYVREVVQRFAGRIEVESELGKGTTFIIILPLAPGT